MKKLIVLLISLSFLGFGLMGDIVKKSKSEVSFKKFGTYKSERVEKINSFNRRTDRNDKFKGKGFFGKSAAKLFFRSGSFSDIINLKESKKYKLNHKKKRCSSSEIKKLDTEGYEKGSSSESEEDGESSIKITKNEFKVLVTNEKKDINNFPSKKYIVSWIVEWESTESEEKGSSKLESIVWATPLTSTIKTAMQVEKRFYTNYMKKLGLSGSMLEDDVLGKKWMKIFMSLSKASDNSENKEFKSMSREMKKLKGYPVIVDGKYFSKHEGGEEEGGKKSVFGKLKKKLFKKKKKNGGEDIPKFTFYTEILDLAVSKVDKVEYSCPEDYKKR